MAGNDSYYPGVQVIERPFQPNTAVTAVASAVGAFIGKANQGPETPYRVGSWSEFISAYGTTYTDLHYAVNDFFSIQRITGAAALKAAVNVYATDAPQDPQNPGQVLPGTPPLITFEALNPGAWGNLLYVVITARDSANKRFDVSLYRVPSTVTFDYSKRNSEYLLEQWPDVSLDTQDSRHLYDIANAPASAGSAYVKVSGQTYDPATPSVRPYPSSAAASKFVGGVDGSYIDVTYNSDAAYFAGIDQAATISEPFVLNVPAVTDSDVLRYAVTMAAARGDVFVVIDTPPGKAATELASYANTDLALGTLGVSQPSYGAVYGPWVYLPALGATSSGKTTLRPAGGAVTGLFMATDATYGPHKAPAGSNTRLAGAIDVERKFSEQDLSTLNNNNINVIKPLPGAGIVVYGARTLKRSGKDMYVPVRRNMIYIRKSLVNITAFAPFESNDAKLWQEIRSRLNKFLGTVWSNGGLKGATASEAWYVRCDASNNTQSSIDNGYTNVEVGVSLQTPAEFIVITLGQYDGGTAVNVSNL